MIEADQIVPGLWQGSIPPTGDALRREGFKVLVLCADEWQFPGQTFGGLYVIRAPNYDTEDELSRRRNELAVRAARECAKRIARGEKSLVTCAAGVNRSGFVSALTLHFLYGWSGQYCREVIRKARKPPIGLMPLCNRQFTAALQNLSKRSGLIAAPAELAEPLIVAP